MITGASLVYILILIVLAIIDCKRLIIPNLVVIPMILVGVLFTGHWDYALIMFLIGALMFSRDLFCGGDVKLMSMVGAFMGPYSFLILFLAFALTISYHKYKLVDMPQPFTPFVLLPSLLFLWV